MCCSHLLVLCLRGVSTTFAVWVWCGVHSGVRVKRSHGRGGACEARLQEAPFCTSNTLLLLLAADLGSWKEWLPLQRVRLQRSPQRVCGQGSQPHVVHAWERLASLFAWPRGGADDCAEFPAPFKPMVGARITKVKGLIQRSSFLLPRPRLTFS